MRRAGPVLVVAVLIVAAWSLGRRAGRAAGPSLPGAGAPKALPAPSGVRPYKLRLISKADGRPIAAVRVAGDDVDLGTTDAEGQLVVPDDSTIKVRVAGYVPEHAVFTYEHTVWLELTPGVEVSGTVVDAATRKPVAGAFVARWEPDGDSWEDFVDADEQGRFEIVVPRGQPFLLEASAHGLVAAVVERRVADAPLRDLEVVVGKGGVLEGAVTLADGAPPGRPVMLLLVHARPPGGEGEAGRTCFETDAAGHFRLPGVPVGIDWCVTTFNDENGRSEPVRFEHEGELGRCHVRIPARAALTVKIEAPEPPAPPGEEEAEPAGDSPLLLACACVESDDDRPGAPKLIGGRQWGPETTFDLPPGAVKATVTMDGWPAQERRIVLREGETREEAFRFEGGETLEGVLLDVDGTPDKEIEVKCKGIGFEAECKTDLEGRFLLRGLPKGSATLVAGWWNGTVVWRGSVPASGLVVQLPRAALLTGRIAGATGPGPLRMAFSSEHVWYEEEPFLLENGRFSQEITVIGEAAAVSLLLDDFGAPAVFALPPLRPGEVRDLGEIRLDHGRAVRGGVVDLDGRPVAEAKVVVLEVWSDAATTTDAEGRFSFNRMPGKPLWLRVRAVGFPPHIVCVEDGGTIRLGVGGTVTGGVPVTVRPQGDEWLDWRYAETRIDAFPATLQAGTYLARWDDGRTADLVVRDGATATPR